MQVKLIDIGNSKGIRIPKAILQQVGWDEYAELEVHGSTLILKPLSNPRAGWEEAFRKQPPAPLDQEDQTWLAFDDPGTLWDESETW